MVQDEHAVMRPLALTQLTGPAKAIRRAADVQGAKALVDRDALGPQRRRELRPRQAEAGGVELPTQLVVTGLAVGDPIDQEVEAGCVGNKSASLVNRVKKGKANSLLFAVV